MREAVFCAAAGATLLIASAAQAMPPNGPALTTAIHQQTNIEQVRCRGHRCYVSRPRYYSSRPQVRSSEPSNAWEYNPLNNSYYWGSGALK
jgi:hypothetical protein